ncbi:MAG: polysaccharide biosynthesis protein [Candidatus Parcubacteria bacterium]|nr:polysaccharide biosynthesis protein [Candidatus Parcubacteria bacterium]
MNKYLIYGGTGSLGLVLVEKLLTRAAFLRWQIQIHVVSRGEEKIVRFREKFGHLNNVHSSFCDIRDYDAVKRLLFEVQPDVVINCAALKDVPEGEEFPVEFLKTNTFGTHNIVRAAEEYGNKDLKVLSISTDKACAPLTAYGMTKSLQERIHLRGKCGIFNVVRYGNVLSSRGSVIPFFKDKLSRGEKLPITDERMTRFFISLEDSVELIFDALNDTEGGKIFVPKIKSMKIIDLAHAMLSAAGSTEDYLHILYVGIRPGEKIHESLISADEAFRVENDGKNWVIHDMLSKRTLTNDLKDAYSSDNVLMNETELKEFLIKNKII